MSNTELYLTKRVFKNGDPQRIVDEDLSRDEAQLQVSEDMESNPNSEYYMLVFTKM